MVPKGYQSPYPYAPTGKMPGPEESPIPDPLVWLSYAAAVTKKIKLATGILILPQRHPVYVAKEVATLDQLSAGRALLGVGVGWLEEEFDVLGVPFAERGPRTDESIRGAALALGRRALEVRRPALSLGGARVEPEAAPAARCADRDRRPHAGRGEARRAPR